MAKSSYHAGVKHGYRIKLYKHPKLKFVVRGKVRGKWDRKYFRTKGEAQTYCELKNIELTNQGKEAVEFPSWLRVMAGKAHEKLHPHGRTIEEAVSFYLEHLAKLKKSVPLRQAMDELIENRRDSGSSNVYCADLKCRLGKFCREFQDRNTEGISTAELDQWLAGLKVAPVTRNTYRRDLRTLFSFCVSRGYSSANPVERTRIAKDVSKPVEILTADQTSRLLTTAIESLVPYIAIGAFAGLRAAEVERLDWRNVDLESGLIEVTARNSKTATRRLVKILPNLRAWLTPLKKPTGPVVPLNLRKLMIETRRRAGLSEWPNNALRLSYASYHIAQFNDAPPLALQMGHGTTTMIFAHYREVVRPKEAERYWKIAPAVDVSE